MITFDIAAKFCKPVESKHEFSSQFRLHVQCVRICEGLTLANHVIRQAAYLNDRSKLKVPISLSIDMASIDIALKSIQSVFGTAVCFTIDQKRRLEIYWPNTIERPAKNIPNQDHLNALFFMAVRDNNQKRMFSLRSLGANPFAIGPLGKSAHFYNLHSPVVAALLVGMGTPIESADIKFSLIINDQNHLLTKFLIKQGNHQTNKLA